MGTFLFAQTPPPQSVPTPATDLFNGFESLIIDSFANAVNTVFRSEQYTLWVAVVTVIASWLFFNRLLIDFSKGLLTGKGSLKDMVLTTALMFFNFFLVLNPKPVGEFVFSMFEYMMAIGNGFILNVAGQSLDLSGEIGTVAQSMGNASGINALNIMTGISWLLVAIGTTFLAAIYYVHLIMAFFQIYIVFPMFLRFGQSGLFMKETQGWFYSLLTSALEQMFIPLLGKLSIGITFLFMQAIFDKINAQQGTFGAQNVANGIETVMAFIFLLMLGIVFQLNVPKLAKLAAISASGAASNSISAAAGAAGLFSAAFKPALGIAKLPVTAPVAAVKGGISAVSRTKNAWSAGSAIGGAAIRGIKSKFGPKGPATPEP
jgi:hypothetical protein